MQNKNNQKIHKLKKCRNSHKQEHKKKYEIKLETKYVPKNCKITI